MVDFKHSAKPKFRCTGWNFVSLIFIAFGLSLVIFFPYFYNYLLLKNLELHSASRTYSEWKAPTVPLYMDIYMFNWTNPDEIRNKSSKPSFTQLGPYRFREFRDKLNISFDAANMTVSYRKISTYHFDPDDSKGSLTDLCTTVNMVAIGAANLAKTWSAFNQKAVSLALSTYGEKLQVTKTVRELLFDGYEDNLVKFSFIFDKGNPYDRVGFMIKKNATDELSGKFTVGTGAGDINQIAVIKKFNDLPEFPFYEGECQKLKGSPGEFYPPNFPLTESLYVFVPEMCRSLSFEYEKDIELHGVKGHRFSAGDRTLDTGKLYNESKCYASDEIFLPGVMNVSVCNHGHPMFMSFPHFYGGDEFYLKSIEGLNPEKAKHQAYMTIEPTTGIPLEVVARMQTNVLMDQYGDYISLFQDVPRFFLPIFWLEQKFIMSPGQANLIKLAIYGPQIGQLVGVSLVVIGIFMIFIQFYKQKEQNLTEDDKQETTKLR